MILVSPNGVRVKVKISLGRSDPSPAMPGDRRRRRGSVAAVQSIEPGTKECAIGCPHNVILKDIRIFSPIGHKEMGYYSITCPDALGAKLHHCAHPCITDSRETHAKSNPAR